jgi:hypothetical protein
VTGTFDDPNREAVGLPPIWTAPAPEPDPEVEDAPAKSAKPAKRAAKDDRDG